MAGTHPRSQPAPRATRPNNRSVLGDQACRRLPRTLPKIFPTCSPASPVLLLREPSPPHPAGESDGTSLGNSETLKGGKLGFTLIRCAVFKGYSVVVYGGGVEVANTEE